MTCFVVPASKRMVHDISMRMRDRDLAELLAVSFEDTREHLAEGLAGVYGERPFTFCLGKNDTPICILSGILLHPGVWSMGMWATSDIAQIGKFLNNFATKFLFPAMLSAGMHRVECKSIVGYDEIHKWLRFLGFAEGNIERKYGKNKEDFITFFWNEGMPWPRGYKPAANPEVAS